MRFAAETPLALPAGARTLRSMETALLQAPRVAVRSFPVPGADEVLTASALDFVADLARAFTPRVRDLLARRRDRQLSFDAGRRPEFDAATTQIRETEWTCAPLAPDLVDRRVETTGPPDARRVIHGLASGANVYMADFEDSLAPSFANLMGGQLALKHAVRGTLTAPNADGTVLRLPSRPATLVVRPRGWHLWEAHLRVDGQPVPAALVDAGLYVFHNATALLARGSGPYLYLPKLEHPQEARLWEEVLCRMESLLGLPPACMRATVLVETYPAVFCMDELLWELRSHAAGLNLGRWDLLFSRIKVSAEDAGAILPDREAVTMESPFLRAVTRLLVATAHRRGVHAIGGMAAQVPLKDTAENVAAIEAVRRDKVREVGEGHDGTWVAHPALVPVAKRVFDAVMPGPNQIHAPLPRPSPVADLRALPLGPVTQHGIERAADVALRYLASWLDGVGCVAIDGRMEDVATAEIARAILWQRFRHRVSLERPENAASSNTAPGKATPDLLREVLDATLVRARNGLDPANLRWQRLGEARTVLERLTLAPRMPDFLTLSIVERLTTLSSEA
jgi:malate synthase